MYETELNDLLDYIEQLNDVQRDLLDAINDAKEACND